MSQIHDKHVPKIRKMYEKGNSVREMSEQLGVSLNAAFYFVRKHKIARRTPSENNTLVFGKKMSSFKVKRKLNAKERRLRDIGVILYWGEGYKAAKAMGIDFANSDMDMVRVFLKFLREICGIDERKIRILLYCYSNQEPRSLVDYWSKLLSVPKTQFSKPYVRTDYRIDKKGKMPYGLVHIRYHDKKLLNLVRQWIENLKAELSWDTQVVNEGRL